MFVKDQSDGKTSFGMSKVVIGDPSDDVKLRVRYQLFVGGNTMWSRNDDGQMVRVAPAKGEFVGLVDSGSVPVWVRQGSD